MQGITEGDSKEEMPATNAATTTAKGEASDHTGGPSCYLGSAQSCLQSHGWCLWSISVQHQPEVQPLPGVLGFGKAPLAAGLTAVMEVDPVGQPKAFFVCLSNMYRSRRAESLFLCVYLTCITVGDAAL